MARVALYLRRFSRPSLTGLDYVRYAEERGFRRPSASGRASAGTRCNRADGARMLAVTENSKWGQASSTTGRATSACWPATFLTLDDLAGRIIRRIGADGGARWQRTWASNAGNRCKQ